MPTRITWTCPFCIHMSSSRHWNIKRHINTLHHHLGGEPLDSVTGYTRAQIEAVRKSLRPSSYASTLSSYSLSSSQQKEQQQNVVNEKSHQFEEKFLDWAHKTTELKSLNNIKTDVAHLKKQNEEIIALLRKITNNLVRS
jgi:hypothetical protein